MSQVQSLPSQWWWDESGPDTRRARALLEAGITPDLVVGTSIGAVNGARAEVLLTGGRPPCPFCGQPLEPTGHFCLSGGNGTLN